MARVAGLSLAPELGPTLAGSVAEGLRGRGAATQIGLARNRGGRPDQPAGREVAVTSCNARMASRGLARSWGVIVGGWAM
jgi:hypothetical protein